ncbi:non-ribosomal peptide synthetase [Paenibacillus tepidiphilus]|uniref:non-ribosomal peptide synthetase n=1 Tax=Paenibacillus tepidiphilus TaxID=2608683 RepID=UPI00123A3C66|nr:non-ribosomal peptide synthetase [Paenibacillus tepidiphilus]
MRDHEKEDLTTRVQALSESKRLLLDNLLKAQQEQKRKALLQERELAKPRKRAAGMTSLPCTFMQKKFWYVEQLYDQSTAYNLSGYVHFQGKLQPELLKAAFQQLITRHEALRSRFTEVQGALQAELTDDSGEESYSFYDCEATGLSIASGEFRAMMIEEGLRPFVLSAGRLIRLIVYKFGPGEWIGQIVWHHMVSDGYSSGILIKEMLESYERLASGRSSVPPGDADLQYYDYAVHMNQRITGGDFDQELRFWQEHLAGSNMTCAIPADYPAGTGLEYRGDRVEFAVGRGLKQRLEAAAKRQGVTPFVLYLSALKIMLHKVVRQDDVIVGVPVAGRNEAEWQGIVGCFLNMLPVRSKLGEEQTLFQYIQAEQAHVLAALAHQNIPFDRIVEELQVERDLYSTPVYQVVFSYESDALKDIALPHFGIDFAELDLKTAKVDLALEINDTAEGLSAWIEYKSGKFSRHRMESLRDYYLQILEVIAKDADLPVRAVEMITSAEKEQILHRFNSPVSGYRPETLKSLFEAQAARRSEEPAAVCGEESITYGELNRRSNRLAHYLRKSGIGPESIVGILLDKSIAALIAVLGVTKAGGAFMALDRSYPPERIKYMLADSGAALIITAAAGSSPVGTAAQAVETGDPAVPDEIAASARAGAGNDPAVPEGIEIPAVAIDDPVILAESAENPEEHSTPDNLAYLIYTSGTTGQPKGVMVEHTGIANLRDYFAEEYGITGDDVVLQFANLVFDASVWELVMGLLTGAQLCIITKETALDPDRFEQEVRRHGVTVATLPPPFWNEVAGRKLGFRLLITAGSEASAAMVERLGEGLSYYNAYGPSETTVCASDWFYDRTSAVPDKIPIGRPIRNTQIYIMDGETLCGTGMVGELCVAGVGLARGYMNRPELTAERFTGNPFGPGRLYRTGDYASWLEDGNIAFTGRMDGQVKIRGHRIELGEIESKLISYNKVNDSVVLAQSDANGNATLAAYLVTDSAVTIQELKAHLAETLPAYMIPASYYIVDSIPLNLSGKTDTARLAAGARKLEPGSGYAEPTTENERKLARIWSELLGLEKVSVKDPFFEIGGDSIISMQVIARAAGEGLKIELKSFYEDKCIERMALHAGKTGTQDSEQGEIAGVYPLTPIQRWFFGNSFAEYNHWNQSVCLELEEPCNPDILDAALNEVCRQHDVLRTRMRAGEDGKEGKDGKDGKPYAEILPMAVMRRLEAVELPEGVEGLNNKLFPQAVIDLQKSLSLEAGIVFKGLLVQSPGARERLVLTAHHLVCDAVSLRIIIEDLFVFYRTLLAGDEVMPRRKTASFPAWSTAAAAYAGSFEAAVKTNEWKREYPAVARAILECPKQPNCEEQAASAVFTLSCEDTSRLLQEVPKHFSIKPDELMMAALAVHLRKRGGGQVIFTESHGRDLLIDEVDLSRTAGWFTEWYPLIVPEGPPGDLGVALKRVKDALADARKRKFEYLLGDYPPGTVPVIFNYMGVLDNERLKGAGFRVLGGETLHTRGAGNGRVSLLEVNAYVLESKLTFEWVYNRILHSAEQTARETGDFMRILLEAVDYCLNSGDDGLSAADFLGVDMEDLDMILAKFN